MKCDSCKIEMIETTATVDSPYQYDLSGLKNLFLAGITVYECPKCKSKVPAIPRVGELHRVIARLLLHKPTLLSGDEIRFLRKNAGIPAKDFAVLLQTSAEHLSRVENGHYASLGATADRLARAIIIAATDKDEVGEVLLRRAAALMKVGRRRRSILKLEGKRWQEAA